MILGFYATNIRNENRNLKLKQYLSMVLLWVRRMIMLQHGSQLDGFEDQFLARVIGSNGPVRTKPVT